LAFGRDKCIDVLTAEAFEQVAEEMLQKVRSGEMDRNEQRALAANTIEVTIDAQGRVNLDEKLREYAGVQLGSRVIVAGSFDRVEIWEPDRHDRNISSGTEQIAGAGACYPMLFTSLQSVSGRRSLAVSRMARWLAPTPPATIAHIPGIHPGGICFPGGCQGPSVMTQVMP